MMRYCRNKRGVSPVISAVIMMLVVMIGMSALFAFFVNYSRDFQEGGGSAVFESMTVEDIWFKNQTTVELWVYNYGKVDLKISSIYVDDDLADFKVTGIPDGTVVVGGHAQLFVTSEFVQGNPLSYSFKIVTERGTSFEVAEKW
jgi:archaellum component FlaF (FlaF/FlaG flagellin family)